MNTQILRHIWVLTLDEFTQLFTRRRAIVAFGLYVVIVGIVVYGFAKVDQTATDYFNEHGIPKVRGDHLVDSMEPFPGKPMVQTLLSWPITFPLFQFLAVLWMSELIAIVSCDMISRDRERGTLRFLFLRTSRSAFYISKFLAHFLIYLIIHPLSLLVLALVTLLRSDDLTFSDCLEPLLTYSWALAPLIALSLAMTLFCSAVSRSVIGSLLKVHFFWLPILSLTAYEFHPYLSWRMFAGVVAPFEQLAWASVVGNGFLAGCFFLAGFLLFRRAEV